MKDKIIPLVIISCIISLVISDWIEKPSPYPDPQPGTPTIIKETVSYSNTEITQVLDDGENFYIFLHPHQPNIQVYSLDGKYQCTIQFYSYPNGRFSFAVKDGRFYACDERSNLYCFEDTELIGYLPRTDATTIIETLDFDQFSDKIQVIDGAIWRVDTQQPVLIQEHIPPESPLPLIMNCVIAFCGLYVLTWCTGALTEKIRSRKKSS